MTAGDITVRTCLGCGQKKKKVELLRIGVSDGKPLVDEHKKLHGRGGYLCPRAACVVSLLKKKGRLSRALHISLSRQKEDDFLQGLLKDQEGEE